MFYRTEVGSFTLRAYICSTFFAPVTLTLTRWPSYTKVIRIPRRCTGCANMNFLRQGFRRLSSDRQTDRQTDRTEIIARRFAAGQQLAFLQVSKNLKLYLWASFLGRPTLVGKAWSFTYELFSLFTFLFLFYQYSVLSSRAVDGQCISEVRS